ncbi:MAG: hypothetical protein K6U10_07265 [Acidobacteriia bacterium]|nr:hypothetical protein [Methyloceanibacter sp.]MCL6491601.1 hypothetical protein [Terriglobia bacterium]
MLLTAKIAMVGWVLVAGPVGGQVGTSNTPFDTTLQFGGPNPGVATYQYGNPDATRVITHPEGCRQWQNFPLCRKQEEQEKARP